MNTMTNGTITLRRCRAEDAEAAYEAVRESIAEVTPWMPWCHEGYSLDDSRTWFESRDEAWENGTDYDFMILSKSGDVLGVCGLNHINQQDRFANLGYWVRTSRTGEGVASAAVPLLARHGFEQLKLNRLEIVVAVENLASQRVAKKAGAVCEGTLRRRLVDGERVMDALMFSLVPEDLLE